MSGAAYEDSDDVPAIPEPEPARPVTPGSASWAERADGVAPPHEESRQQLGARWKARLLGMPAEVREVHLEARRKRLARIAQAREAAAQRALARRYDGAGGNL